MHGNRPKFVTLFRYSFPLWKVCTASCSVGRRHIETSHHMIQISVYRSAYTVLTAKLNVIFNPFLGCTQNITALRKGTHQCFSFSVPTKQRFGYYILFSYSPWTVSCEGHVISDSITTQNQRVPALSTSLEDILLNSFYHIPILRNIVPLYWFIYVQSMYAVFYGLVFIGYLGPLLLT